jgi:hypothetical protein
MNQRGGENGNEKPGGGNVRTIGRQLTNPRDINSKRDTGDGMDARDMSTSPSSARNRGEGWGVSPRGFNRNLSTSEKILQQQQQATATTTSKPSWFNSNALKENPKETNLAINAKDAQLQPREENSRPATPRAKLETETTVITLGSQAAILVHLARDIGNSSRPATLDEGEYNNNVSNASPEATTEAFMAVTSQPAVISPRAEPTFPRKGREKNKDKEEDRKKEKDVKKGRKDGHGRDKKGDGRKKRNEKDKEREKQLVAEEGKLPSLGSLAKMLQGLNEFEIEDDASVTTECNALISNAMQNKQAGKSENLGENTGAATTAINNAKSKPVGNSNEWNPETDIDGFLLTSSLSAMDATFNLNTFTLDNIVDEIFNGDVNFDTNQIARGNTNGSAARSAEHVKDYGVATTKRLETEVDFDDGEPAMNFDTNAMNSSFKFHAGKNTATSPNSSSKQQPTFRIPVSIDLNMSQNINNATPANIVTNNNIPSNIAKPTFDESASGKLSRSGSQPPKVNDNNKPLQPQTNTAPTTTTTQPQPQPQPQQQQQLKSHATQSESSTPQAAACDNFQPQAFKKNFCLHCFLPLSDHQSNDSAAKPSAPSPSTNSDACSNFQPQTFKRQHCLNCFLHLSEHQHQQQQPSPQSANASLSSSQQLLSLQERPLQKQQSLKNATAHLERKNTLTDPSALSKPLLASSTALPSPQQQQQQQHQQQQNNFTKTALSSSRNSAIKVSDSTQEVVQYLAALDLTKDYSNQIIAEGLDKKALLLCTEEDLKSIGFNLGDRKKVLAAGKVLNSNNDEASGSNNSANGVQQPQPGLGVASKRLQRNNKPEDQQQQASANLPSQSSKPLIERDISFRFEQPIAELNLDPSPHAKNARYTVFNQERMSDLEKTVNFDEF